MAPNLENSGENSRRSSPQALLNMLATESLTQIQSQQPQFQTAPQQFQAGALENFFPLKLASTSPEPSVRETRDAAGEAWTNSMHVSLDYGWNTTLVIIGSRGVGKSTLAVIAAIAMRRRFIDLIATFESLAGDTTESYVSKHGREDYRQREADLLATILADNPINCVIACSSTVMDEPSKSILVHHMSSKPVIYVTRSEIETNEYLRFHPEFEMLQRAAIDRAPLYRLISNFEFVNPGLRFLQESDLTDKSRSSVISKGLKRAERSFLNFIGHIYDGLSPNESSISLSWQSPVQDITYTQALLLPFYDVFKAEIDFEEVTVGVDALEVRIDLMASWALRKGLDCLAHIANQIAFIRQKSSLPIIYNFSKQFFNLSSLLDKSRDWAEFHASLLFQGIRLGVEYVTVWVDIVPNSILMALVKRKGATKLIGCISVSNWDFTRVFNNVQTMISQGLDIIKVTSYALSMKDNNKLLACVSMIKEHTSIPIIAYNEGSLGKTSRCLNAKFSPVDHPTLVNHPQGFYRAVDDVWAAEYSNKNPGDTLTVQEINKGLYDLFILPKLKFYHFGEFSFERISHKIYQAAFDAIGLPHSYERFQTTQTQDLIQHFQDFNFGGCALSEPFKLCLVSKVDKISNSAKKIGAINTVIAVRDPDTLRPISLIGENTDWLGFNSCIRRNLGTGNSVTSETTAVVIGAGGTARAAVYALIRLGVYHIHIYNRTGENARKLVQHFENTFSNVSPSPVGVSKTNVATDTVSSMRFSNMVKATRSSEKRVKPNNFGSISFEKDAEYDKTFHFTILNSIRQEWPKDISHPSIIINCTSAKGFVVPPSWLANPTGGVAIEVC